MSWKVYCDYKNEIDEEEMDKIELPGIYSEDRQTVKEAIHTLVRQKADELRREGLFVTCEDGYVGEVHATDGFGRYVSYNYYSRRPYNV